MGELRLSEIWIYPIKSVGGIRLEQARVKEKGLEYDRRWMLVDENGVFMTQRTVPAMALFKVEMVNGDLRVVNKPQATGNTPQSRVHKIPLNPDGEESEVNAILWNDTIKGFEVSKATSAWFSEMLGMKCRLIYFPESNPRDVDRNFAVNHEQVSLADAYPFLIIGQRSLDLLNSKLGTPLPMNRFRPNFVFTGGEPHDEDTWRNFTIGTNRFVGVKPCSRCVLTTVDQETAVKGDEPLRALNTYRKQENKILFGQNLVSIDHQTVKAGDLITIQTQS